jgi:hypothetical protein
MKTRTLICAALLFALPGAARAGEDSKAAAVVAAARQAIGDRKLDALKTLTLEAQIQRNVGTMQMTTDTEILLELPDRYLRSDTSSGPMSGGFTSGFNGEKVILPANALSMAGGAMIIRMGPGPGPVGPMPPPGEKPSPEEQERLDKAMLRSTRIDLSRLMLGWFVAAHPALNVQFTYAGEAESRDGKADVIDAKNADGFSARVFIDRDTHLPLMVTYQAPQPRVVTAGGPPRQAQQPTSGGHAPQPASERRDMTEEERRQVRDDAEKQLEAIRSQPQAMVEFTLFFDDWQETGGIRFPHKLRRAMSGATNEEWTVTRVKVNPKIDPKKFEG